MSRRSRIRKRERQRRKHDRKKSALQLPRGVSTAQLIALIQMQTSVIASIVSEQ